MKKRKFTCDFETTTNPDDCRVWAYALCEIGDPNNFMYGNSIYKLMDWCANQKDNVTLYFHNLKFDGEFITYWCETNGFTWVNSSKEAVSNSYTTLITNMGAWYSIEIYFEVKGKKRNKVTIYDSLKLLNFSVDAVAKGFDLPIRKLELDYDTYRPEGHELTPHEVDYIRNDVEIMARALDIFMSQGHTKMTIGSNALHNFKELCPNFRNLFPVLPNEIDQDIRVSYKGGFTYLSPKYKEKQVGSGVVFDVNSLYPSIMYNRPLPYGVPEPFNGKYVYDPLYPLYTQMITCHFKLKKNKIPSIQIKGSFSFKPNEYLESSDDGSGYPVTLVLTNPDLELFFEQYDVDVVEWVSGWKFKSAVGIFKDYIDYWSEQKINAKKNGNKAMYLISKLFLNSLYGKTGTNPLGSKKQPMVDHDGIMHYSVLPREERKSIYVACASWVTSYGRKQIIEQSQAIRDWSMKNKGFDAYIYSDTDSIHALLTDEDVDQLSDVLDIDDYRLGALKKESIFVRGKYLRQKCYMEEWPDGTMNVTVAGLPKKLSHVLNFDNFKMGFTTASLSDEEIGKTGRKLTYKHVPGGVILAPTDFTIQ